MLPLPVPLPKWQRHCFSPQKLSESSEKYKTSGELKKAAFCGIL